MYLVQKLCLMYSLTIIFPFMQKKFASKVECHLNDVDCFGVLLQRDDTFILCSYIHLL